MELAIVEALHDIKKLILNRDADRWMSLKEVTEYTALSESTVRRNVAKGFLKASRKTGRLLLKKSNLDRWLR